MYNIDWKQKGERILSYYINLQKAIKYAVFTYNAQDNTLNGEKLTQPVYDYIDGVWLPDSGFELAETSDYETLKKKKTALITIFL